MVCRQGSAAVLDLAAIGANFTRTGSTNAFHLTKEGGHTQRRVLHAADATGAEVERALIAAASAHRNISFFEHHTAVDLVTDEVCATQLAAFPVLESKQQAVERANRKQWKPISTNWLAANSCHRVMPSCALLPQHVITDMMVVHAPFNHTQEENGCIWHHVCAHCIAAPVSDVITLSVRLCACMQSQMHTSQSTDALSAAKPQVHGTPLCLGVDVLNTAATAMTRFLAPVTLLATGGAGQVFAKTTNPSVVTGDGIAMAARARATLQDLEFVQFHPTGFAGQEQGADAQTFLISEALRGEGAHLYDLSGRR